VIGGVVGGLVLAVAAAGVLRALPGTIYTAVPACTEAVPVEALEDAAGSGPLRIEGSPGADKDPTRLACALIPLDWSEMRFWARVDLLEPDDPQLAEHREEARTQLAQAKASLAEEEVGALTLGGSDYDNGVWRSAELGDGGISFAVSDIEGDEEHASPMIMAGTVFTMDNLIIEVVNERYPFEAEEDLTDAIDRTEAIAALLAEHLPGVGETQ
jgi:hypothetical protein